MWTEYKKNKDKVYEELLTRAKSNLPNVKGSDDRFIIPAIDSEIQGNRTFFRNFKEIVQTINRPETHFLKFLTNELGTNGNVEGHRAIFQGKHPRFQLTKLLDRYLKDYVYCSECGKPDTRFITQGRITMMKCDACGATTAIRPIN